MATHVTPGRATGLSPASADARSEAARAAARQGLPRWAEVCLAGSALVALSPVLAVIAGLVRMSSPGPALFRQQRMGRGGAPFTMLKFRSMRARRPAGEERVEPREDARGAAHVEPRSNRSVAAAAGNGNGSRNGNGDEPLVTAKGDRRVTPVGRLLRKTKLDELPELWNVLRGDMSLVGPRPEVARYVDLSDPRWREILSVRPGLTDPVTLIFRNEEDLMAQVDDGSREAFYRDVLEPYKLDGYLSYLRTRSSRSDVAVLLKTLLAVFVRSVPPPTVDELRARTTRRPIAPASRS